MIRQVAAATPYFMEAVGLISDAFEPTKVPAKLSATSGKIGGLDVMIAADLMRRMNAIVKRSKFLPKRGTLLAKLIGLTLPRSRREVC